MVALRKTTIAPTVPSTPRRAQSRNRPLLLDLFCCAGGAAMGYWRAGFLPVGVDIAPQPRYPFHFIEHDALDYLRWLMESGEIRQFAAIHASPPCQRYSRLNALHRREYPDLVAATRAALLATDLLWIMENVETAPMHQGVMICGTALGLNVRRHRLFDSSHIIWPAGPCRHHPDDVNWYGHQGWTYRPDEANRRSDTGKARPHRVLLAQAREAFECPWMDQQHLAECIPPAYTEWLGRQLMAYVRESEAA